MGLNLVTRDINTRSFLLLIIILAGALAPLALAGSINHRNEVSIAYNADISSNTDNMLSFVEVP